MKMKDRIGMCFFTKSEEQTSTDTLVQIDGCDLNLLLAQTAACVIKETETMPIDARWKYPKEGAGRVLAESCKWSAEAFTNALQKQVEFLYAFVVRDCEKRLLNLANNDVRKLIARALSEYQKFKTRICKEEEKIRGKRFGSAMAFYKIDWTDHNEKFLAMVKD